jgi:hypothetical protein
MGTRRAGVGVTTQTPAEIIDKLKGMLDDAAVASGLALLPLFVDTAPMGVRTRGHDIAASLRSRAADVAARDEARHVVERWNREFATGSDMWWSPCSAA